MAMLRSRWNVIWAVSFAAALVAAKTFSHPAVGEESVAAKSDMVVVNTSTVWTDQSMRDTPDIELPTIDGTLVADAPSVPDEFHMAQSADKDPGYATASSGDFNSIPLRYSGKLFFTKPEGTKAKCSAQFIAPRLVLTAAHCVRNSENGNWNQDFSFALQYFEGQYSKKYSVVCAFTSSGWLDASHPAAQRGKFDYALLITSEDTITGYFGWATGWRGRFGSAVKIGYPGEIENGRVVQVENGPLFFPNDRPGSVAIQHSNPKSGKGSSGGAFVANYDPSGRPGSNTIISVTASSYQKRQDVDLGPYLDQGFVALVGRANQGCR